ncbi:nuclear pore complex protein NUP214 isoform X1 [Daucus carota subsp. sativus]|uniref:nuclear pore complex protein NUP214 isoform X1 n=2 Tax=Daucus carota subsp. sativus TaxID=79200 RepID=UPI0007EF42D3|nr:PREDICTED: nuclear pore complex protein NUP214 [Daucus carota subsp. sativus]
MVSIHKELVDEVEGDQIGSKNYRFCLIGEPISIVSDVDSDIFDLEKPPSQPLALSERFGLLFVAHSTGFCVVKTKDAIDSSKKTEGRASVQELSVVDVPIGKVSILALSADSLTLAVSVDATAELHFFLVTALLNKEQKPSFSCSIEDSSVIKDIRWTKHVDKDYLVLLENGKLYHGCAQNDLKNVADNVDAVEWSMRGDFVAVARNKVISILSSSFDEKLSMSLSSKSTVGNPDVDSSIKVDSIRWVRPDCIILGCFHLTDDGTEEGYLIQVITSQEGEIINPSSNPVVIQFNDVFLGFMDDVVPSASGPHMFLSYLHQCQLAIIANRKNVDQHIVLFDWSRDDKKEAAMVEILNDAWIPRIDCRGDGEDNIVIGLSIDKISQDKLAKINFGEETEVSPCCVLACLTVDGKLTFFHFASSIGNSTVQDANCISSEDEDVPLSIATEVQPFDVLSRIEEQKRGAEEAKESAIVYKPVHAYIPQITSNDDYTSGKEMVKQVLDSQTINTQAQMTPVVNLNYDGKGQLSDLPEKQGEILRPSALMISNTDSSGDAVKDLKNNEPQTIAEVISNNDTPSEKLTIRISDLAVHSNVSKGFGGHGALQAQKGSTAIQDSSLKSISSGQFNISTPAEGRASMLPSSKIQMIQSNTKSTTHVQHLNNLPSKDIGGSFNLKPYKNKPPAIVGNMESLPESRSPQVPSREKIALENSSNLADTTGRSRLQSLKGLLSSGSNSSKQFLSVEEMTKELDLLLEHIEGLGGFGDASMSHQNNSVIALEDGIWTLSERCGNWKGIMDKRLAKIQLILEKTVQALARKIYMEGIVKQATDSRYWDLWDHQRLSSELELKRRHLLELNQELTNQLIDLEKHFNSLELNKFSECADSGMNPRTMQSKHGSSRYVNSLHSLQNTMSAQLAAAEHLSKCLSKQMAVLSIESPSIKKPNVKRDLFETIGIPYNDASYNSPGSERKTSNTSSKQGRLSLSNSVAGKEQSWRKDSTRLKSSEPETARRRRDSLDRNWSSFNPPKTTVKRMLLQDNRQRPKTGRSSFGIDQQLFNRELERSAYVATEQSTSSSATISNSFKGKVTQNATPRSPEIATTLFKTELHNASQPRTNFSPLLSQSTGSSGSGLNKFAVDDLRSTKQSGFDLQQTPASSTRFPEKILPSSKKIDIVQNSTDKQIGLSGFASGNLKHEPLVTESLFSGKSSKTQSSAALAFGSAPSLSYPGTIGNNPGQFTAASLSSSSYSSSISNSVRDLSPPHPKPTSPGVSSTAVSSGSLTVNSSTSVLKAPPHGSTVSAAISQPSEKFVNSSAAISSNFSYKPPSTDVVKPSIEPDKKSEMLNSTSNSGLQIGRSDIKLEPPVTSKATSEVSTSSQSGSQFSFSVSHSATKPDLEQPSPAILASASLSSLATANDQRIDNSAVIYTQEDEMEEEAPEESRSTELTLGSLGGFGIGTIPTPTTLKPNPFGSTFASTTSPANPPFSMTVPGGELFKPASFSFPSPQPSQPSQPSTFASFAGGISSGTSAQVPTGGFGHSAQTGAGQQALGSVLGSFGQSRQLGAGLPGAGITSVGGSFGGFSGNQSAGGFAGNQPTGGFSSAVAGGGFASLASAGGGFSGIASGGSGFSGAASSGSGFSGVASSGSGFSGGGFGGFSAIPPAGGFGGAASGTFPATGGGFGGFSNQGSGGGFSSFSGSGGSARPPPNLLTQMRK